MTKWELLIQTIRKHKPSLKARLSLALLRQRKTVQSVTKMKKKQTKKSKNKITQKLKSEFDPLGSYTGSYIAGEYEEPVQDVDDL